MGRLGIRIINVALFTTSCFFAAGVFNHVAENLLAPNYLFAFQPQARSEAKKPSWDERNEILERNLFGAKVAATGPPENVPPPPPEEEAQVTKLPIQLLGTMAGEPAALSSAVIQNTREKKHQVVRIGDTLEAFEYVTVTSIEPRRVLLRNRDITEELLLAKADTRAGSVTKASSRSSRRPLQRMRDRRARAAREKSRASQAADPPVTKLPGVSQSQLQDFQNIMTPDLMRNLAPAYDDDGKIHGVQVGDVGGGGLLRRAGLEPDDVIVSLNGIAIDSAGAAARVLRELSKCKPMTGSIQGASGPRTLEITKSLLAEMNCKN